MQDWHIEYAKKICIIDSLLEQLYTNTSDTPIFRSPLMISAFHDKGDCVWYTDSDPIIDHKIAWGDMWDYNYISDKKIIKGNQHNVIIYNPNSTTFVRDIDDEDGTRYELDFDDKESFLFQQSLIHNKLYDEFCILYALHELKMPRFTFVHVWSENVLDRVIENMESTIEYYQNKRFENLYIQLGEPKL